MIQEHSKPPLIPFPSIKAGDKSYYFSEIVNWIFNYEVGANVQDADLVKIYDHVDPIMFRSEQKDPTNDFKFIPISDTDPDMKIVSITDSLRAYKHTDISCHCKIVYSVIELLRQNIHELILEVAKHFKIKDISMQDGHSWELKIIPMLIDKLQVILDEDKMQLVPTLFYNQNDTKLYYLDNYIAPVGITIGEPRHMLNTYEYLFSKKTSDVFNEKLIGLIEERQQLINKIYDTKPNDSREDQKDLSIEQVFYSDSVEIFYEIEKAFVKRDYIKQNADGTKVWKKKPKTTLIAYISFLNELNYLRPSMLFEDRVGCRKFFQKRYNIDISQQFEEARVKEVTNKIDQYKKTYIKIIEQVPKLRFNKNNYDS